MPQRREFILNALKIAGGVALGGGASLPGALAAPPGPEPWAVPFGAAVNDGALQNDPDYAAALIANCHQIVGEGGLKWADIRPSRGEFIFDQPDRLIDFATLHGKQMRGHTLAWYGALPDWTSEIASATEAELELREHIAIVVGRYAGRIRSWDVVNEAIADDPADGQPLRNSIWLKRLGVDYIDMAFRAAAAADPTAQLVINEYDIEATDGRSERRRAAYLDLIRSLVDRGTPIHAVGLQGHLHGEAEIDSDGVSSFVSDVNAMGLDVLVTELDVIDNQLPAGIAERDKAVAAQVETFLSAIHAAATPTAIITWGITDKYTWVPIWFTRPDKLPNRPLPLDASYRAKPMMAVLERFGRGTV